MPSDLLIITCDLLIIRSDVMIITSWINKTWYDKACLRRIKTKLEFEGKKYYFSKLSEKFVPWNHCDERTPCFKCGYSNRHICYHVNLDQKTNFSYSNSRILLICLVLWSCFKKPRIAFYTICLHFETAALRDTNVSAMLHDNELHGPIYVMFKASLNRYQLRNTINTSNIVLYHTVFLKLEYPC